MYADEFQLFATEDFATLLTEARKFGIATTIAHQARYQPGMTDGIRATTIAVPNVVVFQISSDDAYELAGKFDLTPPPAREEDIEIIDGEEPIPVPRRDLVNYLLTHGHPDYFVNTFTTNYLQFLKKYEHADKDALDMANKYPREVWKSLKIDPSITIMTYGSKTDDIINWEDEYRFEATIAREILPRVNILMYQWMLNEQGIMPEFEKILEECSAILGYETYFRIQVKPYWDRKSQDEDEKIIRALMQQYNLSYKQAHDRFKREMKRYNDFFFYFMVCMDELQKQPIMTESGLSQPRKRIQHIVHAQQTHADKRLEIANTIANLPKFNAWVKIAIDDTRNVEHTIKTLAPGQAMVRSLDQRIATIQAQNRKPDQFGRVYCRPKQEVEKEITKRQAGWSSSAPAQPQKQQQQQARYARQVPLKKQCPNCGTQNDSDAKYCNECGTKL